jgi:hypothetical protein
MNFSEYVLAFGRDPAVGFVVPPSHFGSGCSSLEPEENTKDFRCHPSRNAFNDARFF